MAEPLPGLVQDDDLKPLYAQKTKPYDEKKITANSKHALDLKLAGEQEDGWEILRYNKRSIRLKKYKPADRQLEDDLWCLLYNMGFRELNATRTFSIRVDNGAPRQLDLFAKDDETAFIVECTHSRDTGSKSVKALIDKIRAIRPDIISRIHNHYGRNPALKVKFAIATRNIDWRDADRQSCETSQIAVITHDDLTYFQKLTGFIKTAARYQFLGRDLRGEGIDRLRKEVPATRGRMGDRIFYNFLMSPYDLLRIAYISHKAKTSNDDLDTYQRMIKPARLKAIGEYIDHGGKFPTNIVINIQTENRLNFVIKERFEDTASGILHLPGLYGSAWVVDGQHRLYGYAYAERGERSVVPVLAYENLPVTEEIRLFVDINTQQVRVSRNLVNQIVASLNIDDPDPKKRLDALHATIVMRLDQYPSSPTRDRILMVEQEKTHFRCLTLTSFVDGLSGNNLVGTVPRANREIEPGPLSHPSGDPAKTREKAVVIISKYFTLFAENLEEHWRAGDEKSGYLCTNLGIRALLVLFRRIVAFVETRQNLRARAAQPDDIIDAIEPYVMHVIDYFKTATANDIAAFRGRGSSLSSVDQNCFQMMAMIHDADPSFKTRELTEYIGRQDVEGTKEAKLLIDEINKIIFDDVVLRLREKYGISRNAWWEQGIPKAIKVASYQRYTESEDDEREVHQFLTLSNYPEILQFEKNWEEFRDYYSFPENKTRRKKADQVAWIQQVNRIRNITHHVEKGPLSKDQVDYVRRAHRLVKTHIAGRQPVVAGSVYLPSEEAPPRADEAAQ
jgi:DNA sulfur modification protein DndB